MSRNSQEAIVDILIAQEKLTKVLRELIQIQTPVTGILSAKIELIVTKQWIDKALRSLEEE